MHITFHPVYLEVNQGHGNARRKSLEVCSNDIIALMDADDISYPDRFEKQIAVMGAKPSIDALGGQITEFEGEPGNLTGRRVVPLMDDQIKKYLKKRCPMNQVSVMMRKSSVERAGGYQDWYCDEDYYLWIRMMLHECKFQNLEDDLVNVRTGSAMVSRRGSWKYFVSEMELQYYMWRRKIISWPRYIYNIFIRFLGEVLISGSLRKKIMRFTRKKISMNNINIQLERTTNKDLDVVYPSFSVAMCVYGGDNSEWFDKALKSIIVEQTVKPTEVVVVVDGPVPDSIKDVIDKYVDICG